MPFDSEKFEALVHFICWTCDDPTKLGKVKLNKTLWYSDVNAFVELGQSITGESYKKDKHGPVAPHLGRAVAALEERGVLKVEPTEYFERSTWDFIATRESDMSDFSQQELRIVADAIRVVCYENTASSISKRTHDRIWEIAGRGEHIPYAAVLAAELGDITQEDVDWANKPKWTGEPDWTDEPPV